MNTEQRALLVKAMQVEREIMKVRDAANMFLSIARHNGPARATKEWADAALGAFLFANRIHLHANDGAKYVDELFAMLEKIESVDH